MLKGYSRADVIGVYEARIGGGGVTYIVALKPEEWSGEILPIFIGAPEAAAINMALEGFSPKRPLTHDLIVSILGELGVSVERITIDSLIGNIYTATIVLRDERASGMNSYHYIDARPSDSIAVALRTGSPIYVADRLRNNAIPEESLLRED